ncbi:2-dehydropantoate 2-reductase, partial [Nannochloropsis gaditana CCMP526]|uniref:2-dehydropantoate 2-reductase n=1 Tax=Nannochloropsis gaditana (strain CCMP526) TaxID=1093141 RepID=UPI00029F7CEF
CQPPYSKSSPLQHRYGRTFLQNIRKSRICLVQMSFLSSTAAPVSATAPSPVHQAPARQSILVLGAGAVGSLYGGRLCEAGHDVTFLMRREYDAVAATGLRISSPDGDMFFPQPSIARSIEEVAVSRARRARRKGAGEGGGGEGKGDQAGGMAGDAERRKVVEETRDIEGAEGEAYVPVDWVIVTLKSSSFHAIPSLLEDRRVVGNATRILVLMNGYGLEEDLVGQGIDGKRVFGGMAFVCANRGPVGSGEVSGEWTEDGGVGRKEGMLGTLTFFPPLFSGNTEIKSAKPKLNFPFPALPPAPPPPAPRLPTSSTEN